MKHISLILISMLLVPAVSCKNTDREEQTGNTPEARVAHVPQATAGDASVTGKPVYIGSEEFRTLVHDFKANPDWKYAGNMPAVVDFYADWCKPCKMVAPYMEELAAKYGGQVKFYKVNTDYAQDIAMFYGINSIPSFFFITADGRVSVDMGYHEKEYFEQRVNSLLN